MSDMGTMRRTLDDVSLAESEVARPRRRTHREEVSLVDGDRKVTTVIFPKLMVSAAIVRPQRVYRLNGTFVIDTEEIDDGTIFVRHRDLPVYGYGETLEEALDGFSEMFDVQWAGLVECEPDSLADEAKTVRERLLALVAAVEHR